MTEKSSRWVILVLWLMLHFLVFCLFVCFAFQESMFLPSTFCGCVLNFDIALIIPPQTPCRITIVTWETSRWGSLLCLYHSSNPRVPKWRQFRWPVESLLSIRVTSELELLKENTADSRYDYCPIYRCILWYFPSSEYLFQVDISLKNWYSVSSICRWSNELLSSLLFGRNLL